MQNNNTSMSQDLTDTSSHEFIEAYSAFMAQGDFIALTRQFEQGFVKTGKDNQLSFKVGNTHLSLLDTGVLLVEPEEIAIPYKSIVISSGIHGNETAPIEIVQQLLSDIITEKVEVKHRTLFIMGNPVAMNIAKRFQTENLNRLFCGNHETITPCYEKFRAEKLEEYVSEFFTFGQNKAEYEYEGEVTNYHYDLHTAIRDSKYEKFAIYPYQGDKPWDKEQLSFMAGCDVKTILFGHGPSGTFSYFSSANFSAHAFTVELGKVRPFGENDMSSFTAITEKLTALISNNDLSLKRFDNKDFNLFKALGDITKVSDNFQLFIDNSAPNFTDYPMNTLLSTDGEQDYRTSEHGESIVFPNANVGNGQRAVLMVVPTTLV